MKAAKPKICYLDTSLLITRITPERNSQAIEQQVFAARKADFTFLTSALTTLEISRFLHRAHNPELTKAQFQQHKLEALAGIELVRLDAQTLKRAAHFSFPHLGSLDSIHLGTAQAVGASHFLTNDKQLIHACHEIGIKTTF